jgi:hypothetical protein
LDFDGAWSDEPVGAEACGVAVAGVGVGHGFFFLFFCFFLGLVGQGGRSWSTT